MKKTTDINTVLGKLQRLLNGLNYEIVFGVKVFNNCLTIEDFKVALKSEFPKARPESVTPVSLTIEDFWADIEFGLDYRGDSGAGVVITGSKLEQFTALKQTFLSLLREWIKPDAKIFSYPDEMGIPGYPVWWDFRFIVFSNTTDAVFIFGSASD